MLIPQEESHVWETDVELQSNGPQCVVSGPAAFKLAGNANYWVHPDLVTQKFWGWGPAAVL